ncbi:MAG TPA: glycosyltransferase family 4 protein [Polyangiales bacterium]|nr:glycosyltransferase family 4 protein [Polyangiales bacterium]
MVASNFPPVIGGIQMYAVRLAQHFHAHCDELLVVAPRSPGCREYDAKSPLPMQRLPSLGDDLAFSGIAPLAALLARRRFDAAFATHWAPGFALLRAAQLARVPLPVFSALMGKELIHRPLGRFPVAQSVYDRIRRRALQEPRGLISISARTAELAVQAGAAPDRIRTTYIGVDPERYRPEEQPELRRKLAGDGQLLLSVARLVPRKGIDNVLQALPAVLARVPNLTYAVIGEGPDLARLTALAAQLGVSERVRFLQGVPGDLVEYYNACDLFVMPAREEPGDVEGFGIVYLEANACEKPVIGARAGGVIDAVADGESGLLVPQNDVPALAAAITSLLTDRERAADLGRRGRQRVLSQLSWQRVGANTLAAIESLLRH